MVLPGRVRTEAGGDGESVRDFSQEADEQIYVYIRGKVGVALLVAGHDVNAREEHDNRGERRHKTPLSAAVDGNEPLAVRLLLRRGANPDLADGDGDRFPLHWAAANGHKECIQVLVSFDADTRVQDKKGRTPLTIAVQRGMRGIVELAVGIDHGVKGNYEGPAGRKRKDGCMVERKILEQKEGVKFAEDEVQLS